ncbi:hypothetical protein DV738_g5012, partial [Chaetothyriales sp. CBS 135597]
MELAINGLDVVIAASTSSYKSPLAGTCTTVFSTQKQYSGYVSLPPNSLSPTQGNYSINTFFWFIEARQDPETAPLTVFINGGPGSSSMVGLFQEVGPCQVVEISDTRLGTIARDWGWDRSSNIIFIDQPVQVGLSYDTPTNASLSLLDEQLHYPPRPAPITEPGYTFLNGTFSSGQPEFTANTSHIAAQSLWHFLQAFLATFPEYNPALKPDDPLTTGEVGLNLFTESYGGKYGPAVGSFFQQQNARRQNDAVFADNTLPINLQSLGIINGWIDLLTQTPYFPHYAYNNTYGIEIIDQVTQLNSLSAYAGADGCQQLTLRCRSQELVSDPDGTGTVGTVNEACSQAQQVCQELIAGLYSPSGRSVYDISQGVLDPFPDRHYLEYLNTAAVQQAIGVPVNYTQASQSVYTAFSNTGDYARDANIEDIVDLLRAGTRVALIYGDRDYICNWLGGEAVSFAVAGAAGESYSPWYEAGYAPIVTNKSYIGGDVREFGNLSFSRVYDSGHLVPAYQPETAFIIFSRIIEGTGISLGNHVDLSSYGSFGAANSTHTNEAAPPAASPTCFLRAVNESCTTDQKNMLADNEGVIINGVLYNDVGNWTAPDSSIVSEAGTPGSAPEMMTVPPTMYTANNAGTRTSNTSASTSSGSHATSQYNWTSPVISITTGDCYFHTTKGTPSPASPQLIIVVTLQIDDGTGASVEVVYYEPFPHGTLEYAHRRYDDHRRRRMRLRLLRGNVVGSTAAEMRLVDARARFYRRVLARPWVVSPARVAALEGEIAVAQGARDRARRQRAERESRHADRLNRAWEHEQAQRAAEAEAARRAGEEVARLRKKIKKEVKKEEQD